MGQDYQIFQGYVEKFKDKISRGEEVKISIKDMSTMEKKSVLAKIVKSQGEMPGGDSLTVVNDMGEKRGQLYIKVIRELDDAESNISAETA
jgi:hypothetical protein